MSKCEHLHIQYDRVNDYNYCVDCKLEFIDNPTILFLEECNIDDNLEKNLSELNKI